MPIRLADATPGAYRYPLLIRHLLHTPLATARDQQIVYRDRRRMSYQDFSVRLARLANVLQAQGVEPGTTVAMLDWDSHRYLECFFAVPMMGAVLQTVNVRLAPEQIAYTLRHAGAEVAIVHRDFLPLLLELRDQLPALRACVLIADGATDVGPPAGCAGEYEVLLDAAPPDHAFGDFDENAVATTFYTTGTTGHPKGVCFSHRQIVLHTLALLGACASPAHGQSFRHGDVYMPMTPMFHVHAWGNPYVATLLGVKQVYPGRYQPQELLAWRAREGVTFSHCVPTVLRMLLDAAPAAGVSLQGWKICIGGSALSAGLAREALAQGVDVYAGYGMSETGPVMTITRLAAAATAPPAEAELERRTRTGAPIPLVDLRVIDGAGRPLAADGRASGEIVVRSPWTTPCYLGDAAASRELWDGGWLHTRDVGRIDADGFLQLTDRVKDVIKSGGEWLSSLELESVASRHPDVAEVAVIAVPDERWGERPLALVVPRAAPAAGSLGDEVRALLAAAVAAGELPRYAIPERVLVVAALDRTSVGKIDKRRLRERYA